MIERSRWLLGVPGVVAAVLPKFACPACAAAALGILNVVGLGYFLTASHLLPLTTWILSVTVVVMIYLARKQEQWWPLSTAIAGAVAIISGKFLLESTPVLCAGIGLLVVGSIWNGWPRGAKAGCARCNLGKTEQVQEAARRIGRESSLLR